MRKPVKSYLAHLAAFVVLATPVASQTAQADTYYNCYLGVWAWNFEFEGSRSIPEARNWQECYRAAVRRANQFDETQRLCTPDGNCGDYYTHIFWSFREENYGSKRFELPGQSGEVTRRSDPEGPMTGDRQVHPN